MKSLDLTEDSVSKIPALLLLKAMGYEYVSCENANRLRGERLTNVLLEETLVQWLRENNRIQFKGKEYPFSEGNILSAVQAIKDVPIDGLVRTNEKIYDLICLGKSLQQSIDGDIKSFSLKYIDWENPEKNVFQMVEEFEVEKSRSKEKRIPDIVLFVNGIPLCVIECKSPYIKEPIKEAISQHIRNQKPEEIPKLFIYSQLLLSVSKNEANYATVGTALKFWAFWRENNKGYESELRELVSKSKQDKILLDTFAKRNIENQMNLSCPEERMITEQDKAIYSLCEPKRLLELTYKYILFDAGEKKIARYQQYFCVRKILERISVREKNGKRKGGVVWHTQGSGKSLTMVILAKCIALEKEISEHKIIIVTDRIDLDKQIKDTFQHCEKEVVQATTGKELSELLQGNKDRIITTIIDKFEASVGRSVINENPNIFVLVDESHRGQYGPRHAKMQMVLPNACYIGFTGTPVMKKDKSTMEKFGGLIDAYTIDQAVKDHSVVPLLYEGRHVEQTVDAKGIDAWFQKITSKLTKEQAADLKKKFATTEQLNKTEQKIKAISWDIGEHFSDTWKGTGFKGQLVAQDKAAALLFKKYLDEFGMVSCAVLISAPDDREGEEDIYEENTSDVQRFWKSMMEKYGTEKKYNEILINAFKSSDDPEIIIVVDKLLTGFDAPRNVVLYLTRKLKDHTLLQAIARVNRLCESKDFGYVLDYRGVLENLDKALDLYNNLLEFDKADIGNILTDVDSEIKNLPEQHSLLWDCFKDVKNRGDEEEFEVILADEELRFQFYERLSVFARTLSIALSSSKFMELNSMEKISRYKDDLKNFSKLRISVKRRYSEIVDFGEYEGRIQKLLNTHVGTGEVEVITPLVNIFDSNAFSKELESLKSTSAKADTIAHRTAKTIHERMEEDPAFYKKFSELLQSVILEFRQKRIQANEYLKKVSEIMNSIKNRTGDEIPEILKNRDIPKAYFGILKEILFNSKIIEKSTEEYIAKAAVQIDKIINKNRVVNWVLNSDIQNKIKNEIEDYLFTLNGSLEREFSFEEIDLILDQCIHIAKVRNP